MIHAAFLIPLLPLAGFAILVPFGRKLGNPLAGWLATAMVAASFVVTVVVFAGLFQLAPAHRSFTQSWFTWFAVDKLNVGAGLLVDPLSMTMAAFVTGVSTLIHLYSIGYMEHDEQFPKFFVYLNLFVFSMLMLVLGGQLRPLLLRLGGRRRLLVLPHRLLVRPGRCGERRQEGDDLQPNRRRRLPRSRSS